MAFTAFCTYFFSLFSTCSLWLFERKRFALFFMIFAVASGVLASNLKLESFTIIGTYFLANMLFFKYETSKWAKFILGFIIFFLAVGLSKHIFPGFFNWRIIDHEYISIDAYPYSLWLNIDKIIAGLIIGIFALKPIRRLIHWRHAILSMLPTTIAASAIILSFALFLGVIHWDPKLPDLWLIWVMLNLIVTCVTEEMIFRLFLQGSIFNHFEGKKYAMPVAIGVTSFLFGLYHFPAPPEFLVLSAIAGCFYGYAYHITGRIEASILLHFLVNSGHFFLFTYPMLVKL